MDILPLFPQAVLGLNKLNVDSKTIIDYLEKLNFSKTEFSEKEESLSYASNKLNIFEDLHDLKKEISQNIKVYLHNYLRLNMNFKFLNSWATKTLPNGHSQKHVHCNTFLSGVFYPKGNKNFKISFHKNDTFWDIETIETNNLNAKSSTIAIAEDNLLILFPSDLYHSIQKNTSTDVRYSIAFNINPYGSIGKGDTKVIF
jgi:uncharacterized protein (TIGR02466 family)